LGLNCFSFQVQRDAASIELLWAADNFREGNERPSGSGIPILFPFPGRLGGETFRFEGREYQLAAGDGRGNAIHGFLHTRPWRVLRQEAHLLEAQFTASLDDASILERWPGDFEVTATYTIENERLTLELCLMNPGDQPCPWGLGLHPYFRVPIEPMDTAGDGDPSQRLVRGAACQLQVPVAKAWELQDMLPTGEVVEASDIEGTGGGDLSAGIAIGDRHLDDVFTQVALVDGVATSRITDPASGRTIQVTGDDTFRECVLYTPGHREAVCIEPYSCVPDAYSLAERGVETGLRILQPGESHQTRMTIALET